MDKTLTIVRQFPAGPGGAEQYVSLLIRGLAERGFEITLVCADCPPHGLNAGSRVDVVRLDVYRLSQWRWLRPWFFPMLVQRWLQRYPQPLVISLERAWHQDLLRSGDGVHVEWLSRRRPLQHPVARWFTSLSVFHMMTRMSERRAYHTAHTVRVIANSHFVKDQIVRRYGFPAGRIDVVHNGVDLRDWSCEPDLWLKHRLGLAPNDFAVAFVGSGWERKGLREATRFVETWHKRTGRPVFLAVAGRGGVKRFRHPLVEFLGPLDHTHLRQVYQGADCLLLPSHYDPFANVTLEALASGCPVITSTTNGGGEILTPGIDGAVLPLDAPPEQWADALDSFADPARRDSFRASARATAERFSLEHHVSQILDLCVKVSAMKGSQSPAMRT